MISRDYVATTSVDIGGSPDEVWEALIDPDRIEQYMFGARVETDWEVGSPIVWRGEWNEKSYEDTGKILAFEPPRRLSYSHYSPLSGEPDLPENHHTVTIELTPSDDATSVTLTQDNNDTEQARDHSQENWERMLGGLKAHVEGTA